jgi:hypothetical protein
MRGGFGPNEGGRESHAGSETGVKDHMRAPDWEMEKTSWQLGEGVDLGWEEREMKEGAEGRRGCLPLSPMPLSPSSVATPSPTPTTACSSPWSPDYAIPLLPTTPSPNTTSCAGACEEMLQRLEYISICWCERTGRSGGGGVVNAGLGAGEWTSEGSEEGEGVEDIGMGLWEPVAPGTKLNLESQS